MRKISRRNSGGLGLLAILPSPVHPATSPTDPDVPANAPHSQFRLSCKLPETHVCFLKFGGCSVYHFHPTFPERFGRMVGKNGASPNSFETVASAPSVTPETNRALHDVKPQKSGEGKQGCRNPGNGKVIDPSKTPTSRSNADHLTKTYLLPKTYEQTRTEYPRSAKGWRVSGG